MSENQQKNAFTFRQFEHEGWQMVAQGYHDHFAGLTAQSIEPLLNVLSISNGTSLLDVACGPGYVAAAAALRGARVLGVDFSAVMVEAASRLYPELAFKQADAEALELPDASFDAVSMNFGLLHLDQPEKALSECYRVLKPGGRFAFTVWAAPADSRAFAIVLEAIAEHGDPHRPLPPGPPFFRFSDRAESEAALKASGFAEIAFTLLPMIWELPTPEHLFKAFLTGTPRTGGLLRAQSPADLAAIEKAVSGEAGTYVQGGTVRVPMACVLAAARKPPSR